MSFNVLWCCNYFNTCLIWVFCDVKEYYKIIKILAVKFNILMSFVWQIYMTFLSFRTCWNSWKVIKSIEIWALWRDHTDGFVLVLCGTIFRLCFIIENRFFFKKKKRAVETVKILCSVLEVLQWATFMSVMIMWFMIYYRHPFWHPGPILWTAIWWEGWGQGWFWGDSSAFTMCFISVIIISVPLQIIRH